jgi:hypothetical protein
MYTEWKPYFSNMSVTMFSRFFFGFMGGSVSMILHSDGVILSASENV